MQISRTTAQQQASLALDSEGRSQQSEPQLVEDAQPNQDMQAELINASFNRLQKKLQEMQDTRVKMEFDKEIDRVIIRYSSQSTGEVTHQIPTEKFVEFEKEFVKAVGLLFDQKF